MKAVLKNHRQSPRKVRLLADLVRGKKVDEAIVELNHVSKRAAEPVRKLIDSAVANAVTNQQATKENLFIKEIRVDKGITLKRYQPTARGRATPLHKHASTVRLTLGTKEALPAKVKTK
jgi:large subunit ribosomal protein L22